MEHKDINTAQWQTKVKIQDKLKKSLPFKSIQSRLPTATILAYTGYMREVIILLQRLSHGSRAFIFNAKGLEGFLVKDDFYFYMRRLESEDRSKYRILIPTRMGDLSKIGWGVSSYERFEQELK